MSKLILEKNNIRELPKGWQKVTISDISKNDKTAVRMGPFGSQLKKHELRSKGIRVLWIENVVNNRFEYLKGKFISVEKYESLSGFKVSPDDVLVTMMGTIGRTCIVPSDIGDAIISSHLLKISPEPSLINSKFLSYLLRGNSHVIKQIHLKSRGVVMKGLNTKIIKSLEFGLPPLQEQKRIMTKIEELFSLIDSTVLNLNNIKSQLNQLKQSLLIHTFEKNSQVFREETVNDVVKIIDYRGRTPPYSTHGIPHLRSNNVKNGHINYDKLKFVSEETYQKYMTRGIPQEGDLLFTTEAPLGEVALTPKEKFSLAQRLMVLRPIGHDPKFLMYQIMSPDFHNRLTGKKTGTTVTGISSRNFKLMKLFTTSIDQEKNIADNLEYQLSKLEQNLLLADQLIQFLHSMKRAIMKQAFEGKLVPQDPTDEPAEMLLEKIKQEKLKAVNQTKKLRKKNGK